jgi:uncharacterized membrane protein YgcG
MMKLIVAFSSFANASKIIDRVRFLIEVIVRELLIVQFHSVQFIVMQHGSARPFCKLTLECNNIYLVDEDDDEGGSGGGGGGGGDGGVVVVGGGGGGGSRIK